MTMQIQVCFRHLNPNPLSFWTQDTKKWSWIGHFSVSAFFLCVSWCFEIVSTNLTEPTGSMQSFMLREKKKFSVFLKCIQHIWQRSASNGPPPMCNITALPYHYNKIYLSKGKPMYNTINTIYKYYKLIFF